MLHGFQHFKGKRACWSFEMKIKTSEKQINGEPKW
jgi:hypothetical protein